MAEVCTQLSTNTTQLIGALTSAFGSLLTDGISYAWDSLPDNVQEWMTGHEYTADTLADGIAAWKQTNVYVSPDLATLYNVEVAGLQIGASDVNLFAGINGPYKTDTDGDGDYSDETADPGMRWACGSRTWTSALRS